MNRYSTLGAEINYAKGKSGFSVLNIVIAPVVRFVYNYLFRAGFLDGREGLLFHLYHSVYMSWKYSKAWEMGRTKQKSNCGGRWNSSTAAAPLTAPVSWPAPGSIPSFALACCWT